MRLTYLGPSFHDISQRTDVSGETNRHSNHVLIAVYDSEELSVSRAVDAGVREVTCELCPSPVTHFPYLV